MVKLYYTATSCGAASYIAKTIAQLDVQSEQVDLRTHLTQSGADFYTINPKGNVPALILDDGTILNENAATLQWIADQAKDSGLAPEAGSTARYQLINVLSFIGTEVHASYGPLFNPAMSEEAKTAQKQRVATKLDYISKTLLPASKGKFLFSDDLDIASIYLYIVLSWSGYVGVDLTPYPTIQAFSGHVGAHKTVQAAHAEMNAAAASK